METSDSKASESASAETPTEASVQIQTQQSQPGGRGRRSHWERGRRGSRRTPATTPQALVSSPPAGGEAPLPGSAVTHQSALAATEPGGTLVRHEELPVQFSLGISVPLPQPPAGSGEGLSKVQAAEERGSKSKRPRPPSRRSGGKSTPARKPNPRKTPKKPYSAWIRPPRITAGQTAGDLAANRNLAAPKHFEKGPRPADQTKAA